MRDGKDALALNGRMLSLNRTNRKGADQRCVLIWISTGRLGRWCLWISIVVVTLLAVPNLASGIDYKVAKLMPMPDSELVTVVNAPDKVVDHLMAVAENLWRLAREPKRRG